MKHQPSDLPTREITIGGKTRVLAYPLPSLWAFEDKTGIDLLSGAKEDQFGKSGKERTKKLVALLWAGLIFADPKLSFDEVASWVHIGNLAMVEELCCSALYATFGEKKDGDSPLAQSPEASQDSGQPEEKSGQSVDTTSDLQTTSSVN